MTFTSKEETLINYLLIFYKNRIELFRDIIYQKTPLSLRLLDWLVTNYSKKYNIVYQLNNILNETYIFNIYLDYKNQLKAYSKKFFDPFCRQKRIIIDSSTMKWVEYHDSYKDCDKKFIVTTVGQLNFFRWFIENKILEYALANIKLIDTDMTNTMTNKKKGKRTVLSPSAVKGVYTNEQSITIKFRA